MTSQTADLTVRRSITVAAPPAKAFEVFTSGIDRWWPRGHHIDDSPLKREVIEPRAGGRCYGLSEDGTEAVWGRVLAWEPPGRFVFAWHLDGEWKYDPDPAHASEVEVRFHPAGGDTRVELVHRHIERHGATAAKVSAGVASEGGWPGLLAEFAKLAA